MIVNALRQLWTLQRNQYLPAAELRTLQDRQLQMIVRHAYHTVPYYRKVFENAGITPESIPDRDHLDRIPITTKADLQRVEPSEILTRGKTPATCLTKYTSGSTGNPLTFFLSPSERDFQILINLRILMAAGFKLTDKTLYLISPRRFPAAQYWFQHLGVLRRYYLSVFDAPEVHVTALRRIKPEIIYGYTSSLIPLAALLKEQGRAEIKPKAVFASTETLEPKSKALIASALNADVFDVLGCNEMGDIAWECPAHQGYHLNSDVLIVEFLDDHNRPVPPGQLGRLVCTSLYSYTMPLIRYEIGDLCVPAAHTCSCGRTLPLMESVKGRANDYILLPDGTQMASFFLVVIMQGFHDIIQYRVIQEQRDCLLVQLVKGREYQETTTQQIAAAMEDALQHKIRVSVEIVPELARDPSGKIRSIISKVIPSAGDAQELSDRNANQ